MLKLPTCSCFLPLHLEFEMLSEFGFRWRENVWYLPRTKPEGQIRPGKTIKWTRTYTAWSLRLCAPIFPNRGNQRPEQQHMRWWQRPTACVQLLSQVWRRYSSKKTEVLAPGRPIWALASDGSWAVRFGWRELISRRSRCEASNWCEQLLRCCEELFPYCELSSLQHSTNDVASVLRTCSEHVANKVTCNIQTSGVFLSPPPTCCDHVATMLRPCCDPWCVQHPTSGALPPPSSSLTQHQHYMSATSKLNIRNIC
jgi:hypothetical protein